MITNIVKHVEKLRRHVAIRIAPYRALLLAFSGGLDSTVLLDVLTALRESDSALGNTSTLALRAVHVHHGLSGYANYWAAHCAYECYRRNVSFTMTHVALDRTPEGLEAAGRSARYQTLSMMLRDNEVLLTAHHQDDQAETLFLALKRGSGPAGLASMATDMPFRGRRLVRPLLEYSRVELERYAHACGLRWIEDDSNNNLQFDRNFLRLWILPLLRRRWPKFTTTVARSAELCAKQEQLLDELLKETLEALVLQDGSLCLPSLIEMSDIRREAILRRWLSGCGVKMPSRQQLVRIWKEVALSRRDAVAQMKLGDRQVRRFRDRLYVLPLMPEFSHEVKIVFWPPQSDRLRLPAGLGILYRCYENFRNIVQGIANMPTRLDYATGNHLDVDISISATGEIVINNHDIINSLLPKAIVRAPRSDERVSVRFGPVHGLLYIIGRRRGRTLKKIWQERAIPPWRRSNTPLLFYNEQLIAAMGVFITWEGAVRESEEQWHLFWQADDLTDKLSC